MSILSLYIYVLAVTTKYVLCHCIASVHRNTASLYISVQSACSSLRVGWETGFSSYESCAFSKCVL